MPPSATDELTSSSLRTQAEVDALCKGRGIVLSKGFTVSPAEADRDVSSPPPAGAVCVHVHALEAGFCCDPRQDFFNKVLSHFGMAPSQLGPSAWWNMAWFVGLCHSLGVEPSVAVFRRSFSLFSIRSRYYFFFKRNNNYAPFPEQRSTPWNWKKSFFLVWSPVPWTCPVVWGNSSASSNAEPDLTHLTEGERSAARKLSEAVYHRNRTLSLSKSDMNLGRTDASSAQVRDPAADAMVNTTTRVEKETAVVKASVAPGISGKKRNREEAHTKGPMRLDLRRVSPPDFCPPDVNAAIALPDIQLVEKQTARRLPELLDGARKDDALREEEMKKTKAHLSKANELVKLEKENADALREELKKIKVQAKLVEKQKAWRLPELLDAAMKADALREKLKKATAQLSEAKLEIEMMKSQLSQADEARKLEIEMMKAQLSKAEDARKLEREDADALRDELKEVKAEAKVARKEYMREIMDKCSEIASRPDL